MKGESALDPIESRRKEELTVIVATSSGRRFDSFFFLFSRRVLDEKVKKKANSFPAHVVKPKALSCYPLSLSLPLLLEKPCFPLRSSSCSSRAMSPRRCPRRGAPNAPPPPPPTEPPPPRFRDPHSQTGGFEAGQCRSRRHHRTRGGQVSQSSRRPRRRLLLRPPRPRSWSRRGGPSTPRATGWARWRCSSLR